jgi:hypothetical protein
MRGKTERIGREIDGMGRASKAMQIAIEGMG